MTIILMILLMCVLIIPHEFGHFITAKACGVQVNEFSIGMGPLLYQKQRGETMYSLRLVPIGGYCAMEGENEESDNPRSFNNKPALAKIAVVLAGAFMNILIAVVIITGIIMYSGYATNYIGSVMENSPAMEAGIMADDKIVEINGSEIKSWDDVIIAFDGVESDKEQAVDIKVNRAGEIKEFSVVPELNDEDRYVIGITTRPGRNIFRCAWYGVQSTWALNMELISSIRSMFADGIGKDDVTGPVGMAQVVNQSAKVGIINYVYLLALISLNLALINLLPFPALDGGRFIFIIIRKITGNMISDNVEGYVHAAGMVILLALFVIVTWNDIMRLFFR